MTGKVPPRPLAGRNDAPRNDAPRYNTQARALRNFEMSIVRECKDWTFFKDNRPTFSRMPLRFLTMNTYRNINIPAHVLVTVFEAARDIEASSIVD